MEINFKTDNLETIKKWLEENYTIPEDYSITFEVRYNPKFKDGDRVEFIEDYSDNEVYETDKGDKATVISLNNYAGIELRIDDLEYEDNNIIYIVDHRGRTNGHGTYAPNWVLRKIEDNV